MSSTKPFSSTGAGLGTRTSCDEWIGRANSGDFGYEVWDTKLARRPKAAAVLQLCSYSDRLARIQGVDPLEFHLVLGNQELQSYRLRDYVAYYRMIRDEFIAAIGLAPRHLSRPGGALPDLPLEERVYLQTEGR